MPRTPPISVARLLREPSQLVQLRPEDPNGHVGRRAAQSFVDAHAEGRREEDGHAGHALRGGSRIASSSSSTRAVPLRLQDHEHIRDRVRHRIFRRLGATGPPHDIVHFGKLSQQIFDAVIEAIDLFQ